jgi:hypothetical protein
MVGHSIRGMETGSDSKETHPMCSLFGAVHKKHTLVRVLLFASEIKFLKIQPDSRVMK